MWVPQTPRQDTMRTRASMRGLLFGMVTAVLLALGCGRIGSSTSDEAPPSTTTASTPTPSATIVAPIVTPGASGVATGQSATLPLLDGTTRYVGVSLDWTNDTVAAFTGRSGLRPAVLVNFFPLPLEPVDRTNLAGLLDQAKQAHAIALATIEPRGGLSAVTNESIALLVADLKPAAEAGVPVLVRFGHEMNGSWYPWAQAPIAYREAFARVATAVHQVPGAAMLWAPSQGSGYPFIGGTYGAKPGTPEFTELDTNKDGKIDQLDDPYAPYWPGEQYVDWVGMSLYHFGVTYPFGANELPEPGKFVGSLSGAYVRADSSDQPGPDFYREYAERYKKPLAIAETAALYNPAAGGVSEEALKSAWVAQVFAPEVGTKYPLVRMINWFEWRKPEGEIGGAVIDWRVSSNVSVAAAFVNAARVWANASR